MPPTMQPNGMDNISYRQYNKHFVQISIDCISISQKEALSVVIKKSGIQDSDAYEYPAC